MQKELSSLLKAGGFHIRKWASNSREFLDNIPPMERASTIVFDEKSESTKSLGIRWKPQEDYFHFDYNWEQQQTITKRNILSNVSRIFDPLGWLAPFTVKAKILLQRLWLIGLSWDESLPDDLVTNWKIILDDIDNIKDIKISRWTPHNDVVELHGFCDASELAYAAVVYWKSSDQDGKVVTKLIAAKTKVAPISQVSLPRLELNGAVLLCRLMNKLKKVLGNFQLETFLYTDSTIVLNWLADHPRRWKTYVANRTSLILRSYSSSKWRHIPSLENPADVASRGTTLAQLNRHDLWWKGPEWLRQASTLTKQPIEMEQEALDEQRVLHSAQIDQEIYLLINRYSSLKRTKRIAALCFRFSHNCKSKRQDRKLGPLTLHDLDEAFNKLIEAHQAACFEAEVIALSKDFHVHKNSPLFKLSPIFHNGILRVGGRIENADIPYHTKHPIILSRKQHLSHLIVHDAHIKNLHAGPMLLTSTIKQDYHIIGGTYLIKTITRKCVTCIRYRGVTAEQQLGNLPKDRLRPARAFQKTGVDYAGPVLLKRFKGRCNRFEKA